MKRQEKQEKYQKSTKWESDCMSIIAMLYFGWNNRVTGWQTSILT